MAEAKDGCVKPSRGPILEENPEAAAAPAPAQEAPRIMTARVGHPAPDFETSALVGNGFEISGSDYKGKWVALCFYPGDFTFV